MKSVVVGFSGGVDSAVTTALLQRAGYHVFGAYLDNADDAARDYAVAAAKFAGIELSVIDVKRELEEKVIKPFTQAYLRGETPNPCVICNPGVKFKSLLAEADRLGAEYVATGHYARAENGAIYKGRPSNDQSYMLCRLLPEQARRLILPLGGYEKREVRAMAEELKLPAAKKPDSMEICFIPDKDYVGYIGRRAALPGRGDFVFHGQVIGEHEGITRYTVGQRRAGLYEGRKLYISRIDPDTNSIELALWEELFKSEVCADSFNWLIPTPEGEVRGSVRVRHTKWEEPPCSAFPEGESVRIVCDTPVRAPAPGQSAVLYDGDRLLGGGFITAE